ncbi:hypothetical protein [Bartonella rattaustraliani]|uniref:hypothetical protein n=1 Tax=Bartonella rattaustraliani TaxID=481139 RepID=UPI0012EB0323|nr:hypothetical protein [Bartonella rattaustraliani]
MISVIDQQRTDRLLIHGDVSGTTAVYVTRNGVENNVQSDSSIPDNRRNLSLIQVSGDAKEDSFQLVNGYNTLIHNGFIVSHLESYPRIPIRFSHLKSLHIESILFT